LLSIVLVAALLPDGHRLLARYSERGQTGKEPLPDIILVVLDTLRADHLSSHGYREGQTPSLDRLARESMQFRNAYSTSPWTIPSHASMFTGLLPNQHHADWGHTYLDGQHLTIAEYLRERGYRTAGFCENPNITMSNGFAQGFSEFHDTWRVPLFSRIMIKANDRFHLWYNRREYAARTLGLFRRWMKSTRASETPSFAFINLMAAHLPRYPRSDLSSQLWAEAELERIEPINRIPERFYLEKYRLNANELDTMREIYDQEIRYLDGHIGELIAHLEEKGTLDSSVLIVTSDHGELFGEHGYIEHQLCLYEPVLRVPFFIRYPKHIKPRVVEKRVSTASIFETVIDLLHTSRSNARIADIPTVTSVFQNEQSNQPVVAEYANGFDIIQKTLGSEANHSDISRFDRTLKTIITERYKYISYSTGNEELFDILEDPNEEANLSSQKREIAQLLQTMLSDLTSGTVPWTRVTVPPSPDAAALEALKALGYVD
jgi:arylsulfatase A-like enzyme